MGTHCHILGLTRQIRQTVGKQAGDTVHIVLYEDMEPRTVNIPDDFKKLLDENHKARTFFNTLSYTNRKQYILWISSAKKEATRKLGLEKSIGLLLDKVKHP